MKNVKTIIIGVFLRDGASVSTYFLTLSNLFVKLGYQVIIIADEHRHALVNETGNPMILTWPSYSPTKLQDFLFLSKLIRSHDVVMLISNFNTVNFFMIAGYIYKIPQRIAWMHTVSEALTDIAKWKFIRKRFIYKLATNIIVNSKATFIDAVKTYKIKEGKIILLPNLVNEQNINCIKIDNKIVFVGRFHKSKGLDTLIHAFSKVIREFPSIHLDIIGADGDNMNIRNLIEEYNLNNSISLLGKLSKEDVLKHFSEAQFSIVPSLAEAFGLVVIESFSVKTTVIGSSIGGIAEIIDHKANGLLFEAGNSNDLAEKMALLLKNNDLLSKYSEKSYETFINKYSLEKNINMVAKKFNSLIERNYN